MRQIERWLHQHIFKVGWLLSHNYETTTILYYTVFLPGVILHEVIYWLIAGVMNVRADRSIQWPEKQEIGNLQLNFIKLSPKANPLKRAVISAAPLIAGLLVIWLIGVNIFQLETVMSLASSGKLEDVAQAINYLISVPDFWLWFYISFTVANTMFPTIPKDMRGWWQIVGAIAVILIALLILGVGQSLLSSLGLTLAQILNSLSATLLLVIGINITMVLILGLIEYTIERITGHSATFQKGKMITMTREEALQRKQEEQEKRLAARSSPRRRVATADPGSIYTFEFPIPGPPGQEPITKGVAAILGMDSGDKRPDASEEDEIIETTATDSDRQRMLRLFPETETSTDQSDDESDSVASRQPALPSGKQPVMSSDELEDKEPAEPQKKPAFSVREFKSLDIDSPDEDDEFEDDEIEETSFTSPLTRRPGYSPVSRIGDEKAQTSPIPKPVPGNKSTNPIDAEVDDEPDTIEDKPKTAASTAFDLSTLRKPVIEDDGKADEFKSISREKPLSPDDDKVDEADRTIETVSRSDKQSPVQTPVAKAEPPQSIRKEVNIEDDDEEEDEELSTASFRQKNRFSDRIQPPSDDEKQETASPFSRPFVKRDKPDFDEDEEEDEETLESTDSSFARPFALNNLPSANTPKEKPISSDWRSKLGSAAKNDDDEDDEQLSTRRPRTSSVFDSLGTKSDKSSTPKEKPTSPDWRSKLSSSAKDDEEDDEDEQLSTRRPRTSSVFDSLNTKSDESSTPKDKPVSSDWRSKLGSSAKDDDDDEDDEQLSIRRPRTSSVFDPLGTKSDESSTPKEKPISSDWRSKLGSSAKDDDDDEDDEQLSTRRPRTSSVFDSLSTKSGESSTPNEKPVSSDWRSKLSSSAKNDDDEDDEQLSTRRPRTSSVFDSINTKSDKSNIPKEKPVSPDWRSQLGNSTKDDEEDDDEQLGGRSILSGLGRPQSKQPRSSILGSGSHQVPKPTGKSSPSDWRSQLTSQDEDEDDDIDEISYEPLEDDITYEYDDDDDYGYGDDDGDFYDDED